MTRTLTTTAVASTKKTINPMDQPCFTTWTYNYNTHGAGYTGYDHNFNIMNFNMGDGDYQYNKYRTYGSYSPEFFNNYHNSDYMATEGGRYPSSSSNYGSNTTWVGYLGHLSHQSPSPYSSKGGWITGWPGVEYAAYGFRDVCTLPNEDTQDYAVFGDHNSTTGTWMAVGPRSKLWYYDTCQKRDNYGRFNVPARSGYQGMYGCMSYNPKIKKLAVMESTGNWDHRPRVWNSVPDLRAYGNSGAAYYKQDLTNPAADYPASGEGNNNTTHNLGQFFQNGANVDDNYQAWNTGNGSWGGRSESHWRGPIVLCDNGAIVMHSMDARDTGGYLIRRWAGPQDMPTGGSGSTLTAYTPELIYHHHNGGWNCYGYGQGTKYGCRWQQSSDGRYVWMYSQAYYYGSGFCWTCVRVADGKVLRYKYDDSTHGWHFFPVGKSSMGLGNSENADNPGYRFRVMNLDTMFEMWNDKDSVNIVGSETSYVLNVCNNSTSYPHLIPAMYDTAVFSEPNFGEIKRT